MTLYYIERRCMSIVSFATSPLLSWVLPPLPYGSQNKRFPYFVDITQKTCYT